MTIQNSERVRGTGQEVRHGVEASNRQVVLFHLKKTSGTSVYRHLRDAVRPELCAPWNAKFEDAQAYPVLGGHYDFEKILKLDAINICFLREPTSRVISYYNYVQTLPESDIARNDDAGATAMRSLSFEECLDSDDPNLLWDMSNYYCKSFFGIDYDRSSIFRDDGSLTSFAAEIVGRIDFFGFRDDFQTSISKLMSFLGLSQPKKMHQEKNIDLLEKNQRQIDIKGDLLKFNEKLKKLNLDDILFYRHALARNSKLIPASAPNTVIGHFPTIYAGQDFRIIGKIDVFSNMLYSNWHNVEEGVWSNGSKASLALIISESVNVLLLDLEVPLHSNMLSKTISITARHDLRFRFHAVRSASSIIAPRFEEGDQIVSIPPTGRFVVNIPAKNLIDRPCHLEISVDEVFVPSMYHDTGDDRELGFKLHQVMAL